MNAGKEKRKRVKSKQTIEKLNRLFAQLIVSACLFLAVFVGGRLIPERVYDVFEAVREVIGGESILPDTVQTLGNALSEGDSIGAALRDWCVDTFLPTSELTSTEFSLEGWLEESEQFSEHLLPKLSVQLD